ncbi:type II toxin-antitoxin system VapC family toxin [Methanospirillum hungatei]|uniref:type II toxin-antitoxin system VapC family toxin n=1 Tax=Methanospirillum hungatei TaxID=2203 RepID=UPI0026ECF7DA|nr:type II toxin-antitoxin system VapC family toxin [Methanospirillum hungatei]MCA1915023.1 type II toxin-antitoxin system VapC family toxin [Methanospirillum hungatei]
MKLVTEHGMMITNNCVIDSSVIIKAIFKPKKARYEFEYQKELETHFNSRYLLQLIDRTNITVLIPRCVFVEVSGVSSRLSDPEKAKSIYSEMQVVYSIIPEDEIFNSALEIALKYGNPGFDNYILATAYKNQCPLFTDDKKVYEISKQIGIQSYLMRDLSKTWIDNFFAR